MWLSQPHANLQLSVQKMKEKRFSLCRLNKGERKKKSFVFFCFHGSLPIKIEGIVFLLWFRWEIWNKRAINFLYSWHLGFWQNKRNEIIFSLRRIFLCKAITISVGKCSVNKLIAYLPYCRYINIQLFLE